MRFHTSAFGCLLISNICRDYSKTYARSKYYDDAKPWSERCDVAFPCASQNEIDQSDAINLGNSGCRILVEGNVLNCVYFVMFFLVRLSGSDFENRFFHH